MCQPGGQHLDSVRHLLEFGLTALHTAVLHAFAYQLHPPVPQRLYLRLNGVDFFRTSTMQGAANVVPQHFDGGALGE